MTNTAVNGDFAEIERRVMAVYYADVHRAVLRELVSPTLHFIAESRATTRTPRRHEPMPRFYVSVG